MSSIAFDTHAFIKRLTQAGMDEQQAEALAECQTQLINDSLATRLDIEEVKKETAEVKREVEELKKEVAEVKRETDTGAKGIRRRRARTGRVFPLCLGRQAVALAGLGAQPGRIDPGLVPDLSIACAFEQRPGLCPQSPASGGVSTRPWWRSL